MRPRLGAVAHVRISGEIVGDFLEAYIDADTVLCSVCKKTKTVYVIQQWMRVWQQVVRRIEQQESANGSIL